MKHEEIRERLDAFCDNELPEKERLEIGTHLAECDECRRTCEDWKKISGALFHEEAPVSEVFVQRVVGSLPLPSPVSRLPFPVLRWLVPAFGMALIALILILAKPAEPETVSAEALLLTDGREGAVTELAFLPESPGKDEILGYVMEESWRK